MLREFDSIQPYALQVYKGKRIIFVAAASIGIARRFAEHLAHKNHVGQCYAVAYLLPEQTRSILEQRQFVKSLLTGKADHIVIITGSPFILSDAFSCQVYEIESGKLRPTRINTFGASPTTIACHLLDNENSIGQLSDEAFRDFMGRQDWTKPELETLLANIGNGWPAAQLQRILDSLEAA